MKCVHLIVSGNVQGVFFRSNTRDKATELGLKGYAKNLANGNVEIVVQGDESKINELVEFIKSGPGVSKVENVQITHKDSENFESFEIKY